MRLINTCELQLQRLLVDTEIKKCEHPKEWVREGYCLCCRQFAKAKE